MFKKRSEKKRAKVKPVEQGGDTEGRVISQAGAELEVIQLQLSKTDRRLLEVPEAAFAFMAVYATLRSGAEVVVTGSGEQAAEESIKKAASS